MDINLSDNIMSILTAVLLLILPLLLMLIGAITGFLNVVFYLLTIFWFGMGLVFYGALEQ